MDVGSRLGEYLTRLDMTHDAFARLSGIDRTMVTKYASGRRRPGLAAALAIEKATDGEIPATYWTDFKTLKPKSRRTRPHAPKVA